MFDNNLGKRGPTSKLFHQLIRMKIFCVYTIKISTTPAMCWWVCCFEIDVSGCTWAMTPVLGDPKDPNVTAFLKALSLHRFCSTCTPTTCQLHV